MTNQEAIEALKSEKRMVKSIAHSYGLAIASNQDMLAFDKAIEALEKQIPQQPIDDDWEWYKCPKCKHDFEDVFKTDVCKPHYCSNCGQAISWEVEE